MKDKKSFSKFLEYCAIRFVWALFASIPFKLRIKISQRLTKFLFRLAPSRVKVIENNLRAGFPDKDEEWISDMTRRNILHLGRFFAEFIQETRLSEKFLDDYVVCSPDKETLHEYFKDGAILIGGHLGNWEFHGAKIALWFPDTVAAVARRQSNFWSNRLIERARGKAHITTIYARENDFKAISMLRKKKLLSLVADQFAGGDGVLVNFFNRPASTFLGPAVLARLSKVKCYFGFSEHKNGKLYTYVEPMPLPKADIKKDRQKWELEFTQIWSQKLEEKIRENPEEYFWVHNRWKKVKSTPQ